MANVVSITIIMLFGIHIHLVRSNFAQLLFLLLNLLIAAPLVYLFGQGGVCLDEVEDGLRLEVADWGLIDGLIAVPVHFYFR